MFSKWVEAFPLQVTDGFTLTSTLMDEVICRYGVPTQLHSDQGSNLNAEVKQKLCQLLGIQRTRTTACHPQGNGQVERFNRTVEAMLAKMVGEHHRDWDKYLQKALFAYRTSLHDTTGYSPYLANFGRSPALPVDVMLGRVDVEENSDRTVSQYIKDVQRTLKGVLILRWHRRKGRMHMMGNVQESTLRLETGCGFSIQLLRLVTLRSCHHCGGDPILSLID